MREGPDLNAVGTVSRPRIEAARSGGLDELALLERVKSHDVDAFERLYRIYQPRLVRFLINLIQRPQLVEEVLDDTMMVVWQTAGSFRGTSKLSTWIFAIAYREDQELHARISEEPLPGEQLHQDRLHDALVDAMGQLSADQRAVVDLTYFHGLGYREIAEIVDCPVDTVKTRMFHARRRLKTALSGTLADWL